MNHLESLVAEWLQFNGYFVRTSVQVGPRLRGGFEGELDVVGFHFSAKHLVHIECSLDSLSWTAREQRFAQKFERGKKYIHDVFSGVTLPEKPDQVALLQYATGATQQIGGARLITVRQFVLEILNGLDGSSPASGAVPVTFPLLRTLQLAADAREFKRDLTPSLVPETVAKKLTKNRHTAKPLC